MRLFGTGAQDGHLDFHTAPELCCCCFGAGGGGGCIVCGGGGGKVGGVTLAVCV